MNGQHSSRRIILGALVAMFAVLAALGGDHSANAEPKRNIIISQNEFVAACKEHGGTSKSVGTRVVECKNGKITSTCNFKTNVCEDVISRKGSDDIGGGIAPGSVIGTDPVLPTSGRFDNIAIPTGGKIGSASASSGSPMPVLTFVTSGTTKDVAPTDDQTAAPAKTQVIVPADDQIAPPTDDQNVVVADEPIVAPAEEQPVEAIDQPVATPANDPVPALVDDEELVTTDDEGDLAGDDQIVKEVEGDRP